MLPLSFQATELTGLSHRAIVPLAAASSAKIEEPPSLIPLRLGGQTEPRLTECGTVGVWCDEADAATRQYRFDMSSVGLALPCMDFGERGRFLQIRELHFGQSIADMCTRSAPLG